jgi:hypothetical protein
MTASGVARRAVDDGASIDKRGGVSAATVST